MAQLNFNATQVTPDTGFDVLPKGWYNAMMVESEIKPTKDGGGAYLNCQFKIMDGQYANRVVFQRFNIRNQNSVAQEIAYKQLSAVCHAVGVLQCGDSQELHGKPLKIKLKLRKDTTGEYEDSNEISQYKNINEVVDMAGAPAGMAPPGGAGFGAPQGGFAPQQGQGMQPGFAPQPGFQQPAAQQFQPQPAAQPQYQQPQQSMMRPQGAPNGAVQHQQPGQPVQQPAAAPAQGGWQQPAAAQPWAAAPNGGQPMQQQAAPQPGQPAQQFVQNGAAAQYAQPGQQPAHDPNAAAIVQHGNTMVPPWAGQPAQ